jgi:hypothetical protein
MHEKLWNEILEEDGKDKGLFSLSIIPSLVHVCILFVIDTYY